MKGKAVLSSLSNHICAHLAGSSQSDFYVTSYFHSYLFSLIFKMGFDGHEVAFGTTLVGAVALVQRTLPKGWARSFVHRHPVAAMSCFWAFTGIALPFLMPPMRRMLKLPTNQYDAEHPKAVVPKYV